MFENIELIDVIITGIVLPLLPLLFKWLNTKIKNDQLRQLAAMVEESALSASKAVYQTYVEDLKAKKKDGKLDQTEKNEAREKALVKAKDIMWPEAKKLALKLFKNNSFAIDEMIRHKLEASVHDLKKDFTISNLSNL